MIASTYSWLSFAGFVSSNRRWQRPPNSSASPKSSAIALAWPMRRYPFGPGGKRDGGRDVLDHDARFLDQPCQRRLRRSAEPEAVIGHQPGHLQEADGRDGEPA